MRFMLHVSCRTEDLTQRLARRSRKPRGLMWHSSRIKTHQHLKPARRFSPVGLRLLVHHVFVGSRERSTVFAKIHSHPGSTTDPAAACNSEMKATEQKREGWALEELLAGSKPSSCTLANMRCGTALCRPAVELVAFRNETHFRRQLQRVRANSLWIFVPINTF